MPWKKNLGQSKQTSRTAQRASLKRSPSSQPAYQRSSRSTSSSARTDVSSTGRRIIAADVQANSSRKPTKTRIRVKTKPAKFLYSRDSRKVTEKMMGRSNILGRIVKVGVILLLITLFITTILTFSRVANLKLTNQLDISTTRSWEKTENLTVLLIGTDYRNPELQFIDSLQLVSFQPSSKQATILAIDPDLAINVEEEVTGANNISLTNTFTLRQLYNHYLGEYTLKKTSDQPLQTFITAIERELAVTIDRYVQVNAANFVNLISPLSPIDFEVKDAFKSSSSSLMLNAGKNRLSEQQQLTLAATVSDTEKNADGKLIRQSQLVKSYLLNAAQVVRFPLIASLVWMQSGVGEQIATNFTVPELWQLYEIIRATPEYGYTLQATTQSQMYISQGYKFLDKKVFDNTLTKVLRNQSVLVEQGRIDIINSTLKRGLAAKYQRLLSNQSFNVVRTGNTTDVYTYTTLYIANPERFPSTVKQLQRLFPALQIVRQDYPYRPTGDMVLVVIN